MPLNFPTGPTSGAIYTYGGKTWTWNGYAWDTVSPSFVNTLNGCTGAITITGTSNQVTVTNSCPQVVIGLPNNLTVGNLTVTGNIGVSGGNITTTATTATLYNSNAQSVAIGAAANEVTVAGNNSTGMTFGMGSFHKFKTNRVITGSTAQAEIFRFEYIHPTDSASSGRDAAYAEIVITAEKTKSSDTSRCGGSQITKMVIAANPEDNTVFHAEYGNISTNGNLASYTATVDQQNVLVYATAGATAQTRFKIFATLIRGEYGGIIAGGA